MQTIFWKNKIIILKCTLKSYRVRYQNYIGSQFGLDRKEVKYIYAPNVDLVRCCNKQKKEIITKLIKHPNFNKNICIFLDQPGYQLVNNKVWEKIKSSTARFLKSMNVQVIYKNHPQGEIEDELYYCNHGFNVLKEARCAEQIIEEQQIGIVVSYMSSTLFNLKSM